MATSTSNNQFSPDYAVHPGEILEETLAAQSISHKELSDRTGLSMKTISLITHRKAPVSSETAIHLEKSLGVSARLWSNLDANYRLHEAKKVQYESLRAHKGWLRTFPIDALASLNILPKKAEPEILIGQLLAFFGVSNPEGWQNRYSRLAISFRKAAAYQSSWESVTCWLRLSEIEASTIETKPFRLAGFSKALRDIRDLTTLPAESFQVRMKTLCLESGVALTFVPELPKTRVCGATLWLTPDKAMLSLSLRYKSDDQFWFSFFHEAGHILLHGKKDVFIEELGTASNAQEKEADDFVNKILFPDNKYPEYVKQGRFYEQDIVDFAKSINLAPGIVVGRLQHDQLIKYEWHNRLKRRFLFIKADTSN
jgi:HTH-type transcriptional regulator/antitoxin HigA